MIIYTLLYYTCIFIRCQRIEGDYRTKAAVDMHNPFFTSFAVSRGSFAVINKRSPQSAGRRPRCRGLHKRRPARILWVSQTCICESFRKKRDCAQGAFPLCTATANESRCTPNLISLRDGPGSTDFRRWDSAGLRLPNTASLRRGYR